MLSLPLSYAHCTHVIKHTRIFVKTTILCLPLKTLLPSFHHLLLSNLLTATKLHPIRLSLSLKIHFYSISKCGTLHVSMTSTPLSPALPLILHVAASRTRAWWIRLAPTHQLSTLPCPLELHPPFSGTTRSLDTPAVGSPMMCCLPYAHNMDTCGSGATVGRPSHH